MAIPEATSVSPMNELYVGLSCFDATLHTASAMASMSVIDCGVRITSAPSTFSSSSALPSATRYRSARASPMTSTGFLLLAVTGRERLNTSRVRSEKVASSSRSWMAASVVRTPGPPALVMMATRRPFGSGW